MKKMPRKGIGSKALTLLIAMGLAVTCAVGTTIAWLYDETEPNVTVFAESNIRISLRELDHGLTLTEAELAEIKSDEVDALFSDTSVNDSADDLGRMVPGTTVAVNPIVTVEGGSEKSYVFIRVEENFEEVNMNGTTYGFDDFMQYILYEGNLIENADEGTVSTDGWVALGSIDDIPDEITDEIKADAENVYFRIVESSEEVQLFPIIAGDDDYTFNGSDYSYAPGNLLVRPEVTAEMMDALQIAVAESDDDMSASRLSFTAYAIQYYKTNDTAFNPWTAWGQVSATSITE